MLSQNNYWSNWYAPDIFFYMFFIIITIIKRIKYLWLVVNSRKHSISILIVFLIYLNLKYLNSEKLAHVITYFFAIIMRLGLKLHYLMFFLWSLKTIDISISVKTILIMISISLIQFFINICIPFPNVWLFTSTIIQSTFNHDFNHS